MRTDVLVSHNIPLSLPFLQCVSEDSFLQMQTRLQQRIYNAAEIHSKFEKINHLDRQDMVSFSGHTTFVVFSTFRVA